MFAVIEPCQHVSLGYRVSAQGSDLKIRLDLRLVLRLGAHIVTVNSILLAYEIDVL